MEYDFNALNKRLNKISDNLKIKEERKIRLNDYEYEELKSKNIDAILSENPISILEQFYSDIKYIQGKYRFSRRADDSTPSCYFSLKGGNWFYKDFGGDAGSGNIISIVRENLSSLDEKGVIKYCIEKLGTKDYLQEALDTIKLQNYYIGEQLKVEEYNTLKAQEIQSIIKKADEEAMTIKEANSKIERESKIFSRITYASKNIPKKFVDFIVERGIEAPSKGFYYIKGENFKEDEHGILYKSSSVEGVGVITSNNDNLSEIVDIIKEIENKGSYYFNENLKSGVKYGGDVHILPYVDNYGNKHKTRSFGVGGITSIRTNPLNKKIAVFESKFDYHAMDSIMKLNENGYDILIANSTNNLSKCIKYLNENNYEEVLVANQFDLPALQFNINLAVETKINTFRYLDYKENEYKQDANDLIYNGEDIYKRLKIGTISDFRKQMDVTKNYIKSEYEQNQLNVLFDKVSLFEKMNNFSTEENIAQKRIKVNQK
jgi:hypothetical protein